MRRFTSLPVPAGALGSLAAIAALCASGCGNRNTIPDAGDEGDMVYVPTPHRQPPEVAWQGDGGTDDAKYGPTVIKSMRLVSIATSPDELKADLLDFGDGVGNSSWYATLAGEYGLGKAAMPVRIQGPAITDARIEETGIVNYIDKVLADQNPPIVPDGHTIIVLYLPPNTQFLWNGIVNECDQIARDDKTFGAYHKPYGPAGDQYIPVMRCPLPKGMQVRDQLTLFASQQIADALTNPNGQGYSAAVKSGDMPWMAPAFLQNMAGAPVEVGDLCSVDTRIVEGQSTYQRFLSNKGVRAGGDPCAPALAVPYYSVTSELDWYGDSPGNTLSIDLIGWSTATVAPWAIRPLLGPSGDLLNYATARVESQSNVTIDGITYQTISNGGRAQLKVVIPPKAKTGWWNLVHVRSFRLDDKGLTPAGEDYAHRWTIGVYVP